MKPYFIIFMLSLITGTLFGQGTSSATASATIVTSVGAEKSGDINFGHFSTGYTQGTIVVGSDGVRTSTGGVKLSTNENGAITFINIIGSSFVYDITVQTDPVIINRIAGTESMKVNLFRMPPVTKNVPDTDNTSFPIGASLTVGAFQTGGYYTSKLPFSITVNFN
jgi:hypothetical protein